MWVGAVTTFGRWRRWIAVEAGVRAFAATQSVRNELRAQLVRLIPTVIDNLEGALERQAHDEHGAD